MEENKDYNPSQYEDDDRMEAPKSAKSIRGYQTIIVILAVILAALSILYFNIHRQQQEEYDLLLVDRFDQEQPLAPDGGFRQPSNFE